MRFGEADFVAHFLIRGIEPKVQKVVRFGLGPDHKQDDIAEAVQAGQAPPDIQAALKKLGYQLVRSPEHDEQGAVTFVVMRLVS